jgi:pyruvate, water dikinase
VIVGFEQNAPPDVVGCKGHNLSRMWQAGLPVPKGFCVSWDAIESLDTTDLDCALARLGANAFAVRSSAVQEDALSASFAGILLSRLNVTTAEGVRCVLIEIQKSALAPAAENYSQRRHVESSLRVAAIVQTFVRADVSGVLFMRDPSTGAGNIVVEACWGLGYGVVDGVVRPDRWTISEKGIVISSTIADKDVAIVPNGNGGTKETRVDPALRRRPCLGDESLHELSILAARCERLFGTPQDIEWGISENHIWLLQSRPITSQV